MGWSFRLYVPLFLLILLYAFTSHKLFWKGNTGKTQDIDIFVETKNGSCLCRAPLESVLYVLVVWVVFVNSVLSMVSSSSLASVYCFVPGMVSRQEPDLIKVCVTGFLL